MTHNWVSNQRENGTRSKAQQSNTNEITHSINEVHRSKPVSSTRFARFASACRLSQRITHGQYIGKQMN